MFRLSFLYLGIFTFCISFFSILNIIFSYYFNSLLNVRSYLICLMISLILAIYLTYFNKKYINEKINFFEKLSLVIMGFFYFPLLIAIPYYLSIYNFGFVNSYFEAISGFTSTGFTVIEDVRNVDEPLLIWRSVSQWIGGLYFLYSLFLLTGHSKIRIKNIYSNYEDSNLSEIRSQYAKVLINYLLLTAIVFLLLTIFGIRLFEGFNLSMTITSSGGFLPTNLLEDIIKSDNQKIIFSLCMLFPLFNLYLIYNMIFGFRSLNDNQEDFYLSILLLFVFVSLYFFFNNSFELSSILLPIISSLSNVGLGLSAEYSGLSVLFLILAIIGGSSFSTSSGLKFIKLYILSKFSLKEIYSIVKPLQVSSDALFLSKYKVKEEEINTYFLSIIFFIFSFFVLSSILSFEEISFKDSLTLSILTITNTVNSNNYNLDDFSFANFNTFSKFSLALFMIIGRVELLSFLILIKKFFLK